MSSISSRLLVSTLAVAGALATADAASAQVYVDPNAQPQPQPMMQPQGAVAGGLEVGQLALGAVGPFAIGRLGYGGAVGETINPVGLGIGAEFGFAGYNVPMVISAEFDYYLGEKVGGERFNLMHVLGWVAYNRAIGNRFVLRPAVGGGLELLNNGPFGNLHATLIGFQGHGLVFVTDQLFIDMLARATISIYSASSTGGVADGFFGIQFMVGAGYAF